VSEHNPYETPQATVADVAVAGEQGLAGRGQRLGAAIIDAIIGFVAALPIMSVLGTWSYVQRGVEPPLSATLTSIVLGFTVFALVHGFFLKKNGQTVGKKLVGIRIVGLDERVPTLGRLLGLRYLPVMLVSVVPVIGAFAAIVDVLFIFRSDRRCIHDLIAGTKVVVI